MLLVLVKIVAALVIAGVLLWALAQFPIDPTIQKLIKVIVVVVIAIWLVFILLSMVGVHVT